LSIWRTCPKIGRFNGGAGAGKHIPHRTPHQFGGNWFVDLNNHIFRLRVNGSGDDSRLQFPVSQILVFLWSVLSDFKRLDLAAPESPVAAR
jgi:hypothetical protein